MEMRRSPIPDRFTEGRKQAAREAVVGSGFPIVELPDSGRPLPGRLAGWESFDDRVTDINIVYGGPQLDGPWVIVSTSRWAGTRISSPPLRTTVEDHMRRHGHYFSDASWAESDTTVTVDDQPVPGQLVRAAPRWWGVRCEHGDVEITVVARDWRPDSVTVTTVSDVEPLLSHLDAPAPPVAQPIPAAAPADVRPERRSNDPHRALVDAELQHSRSLAEWQANGGPPPTPAADLSALWHAAVQRHMVLTDQPESEARDAVTSIVGHLSNLQHSAAWFRDDPRLRGQAISETLLFGTGLNANVASHRAQHAWQRRHGSPPPADYSEVVAHAATEQDWIDAWTAWVGDHADT